MREDVICFLNDMARVLYDGFPKAGSSNEVVESETGKLGLRKSRIPTGY